ncbi:MAG TPA: response regulator transcription factor [Verrucomicrobiae bacterium]|jgi:DNA-binding response OmpR family regulator
MPDPLQQRPRLLIIDDDRDLSRLIKEYLEPLGYEVSAAYNGTDGLERALAESWSAIILDVMLPGLNGFDVLKRLRVKSNVPVLMLTARGEESDRIAGLEVGADDYLPKTFSTRELLARIRAVTRRAPVPGAPAAGQAADAEIVVGELRVNPATRRAVLGDKTLALTALEFDLLVCLARARGRVKSREELVEAVAERNYDVFDRSVDVHVWSLRKKLGDDPKNPRFIRTFRSVGYMLINPGCD